MPHSAKILGLKDYEIKDMQHHGRGTVVWARYTGPRRCPHCEGEDLRLKDSFERELRHETWGERPTWLVLESHKFKCRSCGRYFNQRFPGILPRKRSTEPFRRQVFRQHYDGISRKTLAERQEIGEATVERWFLDHLDLADRELRGAPCPQVLGIDEHFFTRRRGFATTLCDLKHNRVYDVTLGRSAKALEAYFRRLRGKEKVKVVCIDLAHNYRALIRRHFPNAVIVADRFHVIRLVNQQFLATWREIDPVASKNRGLLSLMRRHEEKLSPEQRERLALYFEQQPAIGAIYAFKQRLCQLLLKRSCTARKCRSLIPQLLDMIAQLKQAGPPALEQLGRTLGSWSGEIAAMWRVTKNNGITEGFHNKMEMISRRAFGFRNFENYRLRVRVMCA